MEDNEMVPVDVSEKIIGDEKILNEYDIDGANIAMGMTVVDSDDVIYNYFVEIDQNNKACIRLNCGPHRITADILFSNMTSGRVVSVERLV